MCVIADQSLVTPDQTETSEARCLLLQQLAQARTLSCTGKPEAARLLAEDARQMAFGSGDLPALAQANEHLAWFCLMQSRLEDGLRYARTAISLWTRLCDRPHEAICRGHLAWLMSEVGDEDAIGEAQRAVAVAEETEDLPARALVQNALCVVLWILQQHDLSAQAGIKAVTLARQTKDPLAIGRWLLNAALPEEGLAGLAAASGNQACERAHRDRSISMAHEAATICTDEGDTWAACIALSNLAESLIRAARLAEAGTALEEARSLPGETTASRHLVILHMSGLLVSAEGRQGDAVLLLQHALDTAVASNDLCVGAQIAKDLSASLEVCGRFREALKMYQQYFAMHVRRSAEKSQLRARMLSEKENLRELQTRAETLEQLVGKDALTGLANRRQLDQFLTEQHQQRRSYGLAFIDVDHFKTVNDTLTHLVGDKVLQAVGSLLASVTREGDCLGRFGGEEFLLVAPSASPLDGPMLCEMLRTTVANASWRNVDPHLNITISIGYAFCQHDDNFEDIISIADRRLYRAKHLGRNCFVLDD